MKGDKQRQADVTDADYNAHYHRMVADLQELANSGQVQSGTVVYLESVPAPFLQEAPLLEGEWLDRCVAELAEYGALLETKGYKPSEDRDDHPLASKQWLKSDGGEVDQVEVQSLRRRAASSLAKFSGRTREVEGRAYLHFEDYRRWRDER